MRCPFCKENRDRVIDSRESADGDVIRRRRECEACAKRFTTREIIRETPLRVVKRDATREDFERRKILMGLLTACQKRPVALDELDEIAARVEEKILTSSDREIETVRIGELVMRELKKIDKVAYVRFASVYKNFESAQDFEAIAQEVARPSGRKTPAKRKKSQKKSQKKTQKKTPKKAPKKTAKKTARGRSTKPKQKGGRSR